nr:unnamed protein product [Digitaria exilis]
MSRPVVDLNLEPPVHWDGIEEFNGPAHELDYDIIWDNGTQDQGVDADGDEDGAADGGTEGGQADVADGLQDSNSVTSVEANCIRPCTTSDASSSAMATWESGTSVSLAKESATKRTSLSSSSMVKGHGCTKEGATEWGKQRRSRIV